MTVRPNFERKPPDDCQRPEPRAASLTRMPMFGRTPTFSAYSRISSSSVYFSTTGMIWRPIFWASIAISMNSASLKPLQMIGVSLVGHRRHGQQLGLAAGLEAEAVLRAEVQHFLDDLALLVHLDRVDAAVLALVLVLVDRALEGAVDLAEPVLEDVGEADQDRHARGRAAAGDRPGASGRRRDAGSLVGMDLQVALLADREVALAPAGHVVELGGFGATTTWTLPGLVPVVRRAPGSVLIFWINRINDAAFIFFGSIDEKM